MNNTDKAMELATKMMRDSWATGNDASWQPGYQALRAHIEQMQKDCRTCANFLPYEKESLCAFQLDKGMCSNHDQWQPFEFKQLTKEKS